jgi:hypothetical protein
MAPSSDDSLPEIGLTEAYARIRDWYTEHDDDTPGHDPSYQKRSAALIRALPSPEAISELEIRAVFEEVLAGLLEWGYVESDGRYEMAAYAKGALRSGGHPEWLSTADREKLTQSPLWRYLGHAHP